MLSARSQNAYTDTRDSGGVRSHRISLRSMLYRAPVILPQYLSDASHLMRVTENHQGFRNRTPSVDGLLRATCKHRMGSVRDLKCYRLIVPRRHDA